MSVPWSRGNVLRSEPDHRIAVRVVRWPQDADWRDQLADAGIPRIVVTEPGIASLRVDDPLEAWVPATVAVIDLARTTESLEASARRMAERSTPPTLDESGLLRWAGRTVVPSATETRMMRRLLAQPAAVAPKSDLAGAAWPDGRLRNHRALDTLIAKLRGRVAQLGLTIRAVPKRGYQLLAAEE